MANIPERFVVRSQMPVKAEEAFRWHERPGALSRLMPPWDSHQIVQLPAGLTPGQQAIVKVKVGPFWKTWIAEHRRYVPDVEFQDVQLSGPFQSFEHTHRVIPVDDSSCWLEDEIEFIVPGGYLGKFLGSFWIRKILKRTFEYRHAMTSGDLLRHGRASKGREMKVMISGTTGLVGSALCSFLTGGGHEVFRLRRDQASEANDILWAPAKGEVHPARMEGMDAVIHLAGENIAGSRWSPTVKQRLLTSRTEGTRVLCESLAKLQRPPKVLVCASAIGYYGDRDADPLTEESPAGKGFLPELCQAWESACEPAQNAGIRVVHLRIGIVLAAKGGALKKMLTPFLWGLGGVVGSGRQYWSWIALDDLLGAILHCLIHEELRGPVNATAPNPATNYEFTKTLGAVLHRPSILPLPAFAARLALGEMADELLLASARVLPKKLQQTGMEYQFPTLEPALRHQLGRWDA